MLIIFDSILRSAMPAFDLILRRYTRILNIVAHVQSG